MRTSQATETARDIPACDDAVFQDDRWPFPYAAMFMVGVSAILWILIYFVITALIASLD